MAIVELKYATILLVDGDTPVNTLSLKIGDGNLTYSETRAVEYMKDKGKLDQVRLGDEAPVDVSLDCQLEKWISSSGELITPREALTNTGRAADWVTSSSDVCEPYAVDLVVNYQPPCATSGASQLITLTDFRYEKLDFDLKAGTLKVTGKCNCTSATYAADVSDGAV
jgi:hypothetical protein